MSDVLQIEVTIYSVEYQKEGARYPARDRLADATLPVKGELAWEVYRYIIERVTTAPGDFLIGRPE